MIRVSFPVWSDIAHVVLLFAVVVPTDIRLERLAHVPPAPRVTRQLVVRNVTQIIVSYEIFDHTIQSVIETRAGRDEEKFILKRKKSPKKRKLNNC